MFSDEVYAELNFTSTVNLLFMFILCCHLPLYPSSYNWQLKFHKWRVGLGDTAGTDEHK